MAKAFALDAAWHSAASRCALLRPFPPAAEPQIAGNTVTVGEERHTLVGVQN